MPHLTADQLAVIQNDIEEKGRNANEIWENHPSFNVTRMTIYNQVRKIKRDREQGAPKGEWSPRHRNDPWKLWGSGSGRANLLTRGGARVPLFSTWNCAEVLVYRCNLVKVSEWHPFETIFERQAQKLISGNNRVLVFHVVFLTDLYRTKKTDVR